MKLCRAPLRISFFGGMDYKEYVEKHSGMCIGSAIDKYSYIACTKPPLYENKIHLSYSEEEYVDLVKDIKHRVIRAVFEFTNFHGPIELIHLAEIGSKLGLGSSSSFTAAMLLSIYTIQGKRVFPKQLAADTIHIEQDILKEPVGSQDQVLACHPGLSYIEFHKNHDFTVHPLRFTPAREKELEDSLLLFFTGIRRMSAEVVNTYTNREYQHIEQMRIAEKGLDALYCGDLEKLGRLMDESWQLKKGLSAAVSNNVIDQAYAVANTFGGFGKITGSGSGGTMLLIAPKDKHDRITYELGKLNFRKIDFKFCRYGAGVILDE